ncbi:MAG: aspartate aminotransferase family protein [Flavobacteriaceae bacterium]|nr:aspartate aminotransferase family protein [Flavobacteriaceae bacterium]
MKYWKKLTHEELQERIENALRENVDFNKDTSLGYPASKLDSKVFYSDAPFLKDAPTLKTYVANPNHIGCHTVGTSEKAFKGTQEIEREVLKVLAVDIFKLESEEFDGYIAPGGTEANLQAMWVFRNYFKNKFDAKNNEIVILASEDTHYSIPKGSNILNIDLLSIPVLFENRKIDESGLENIVKTAVKNGKKYFIVISNLATTMFGSVDDPDVYTNLLEKLDLPYKLHIDGAYGGFVYPFSNLKSTINFSNPKICSITIDAHKMLQAPYGTGVYLCRKGLIENVLTKEAEYVEGMDLTLCGSRSGANAIAVFMILFTYGPYGWYEKISILQMRTQWFCKQLDQLNIKYFREENMNIVTIHSEYIPHDIALKYDLVPEQHNDQNKWYKVVIMDHVEIDNLMQLVNALKERKGINL